MCSAYPFRLINTSLYSKAHRPAIESTRANWLSVMNVDFGLFEMWRMTLVSNTARHRLAVSLTRPCGLNSSRHCQWTLPYSSKQSDWAWKCFRFRKMFGYVLRDRKDVQWGGLGWLWALRMFNHFMWSSLLTRLLAQNSQKLEHTIYVCL